MKFATRNYALLFFGCALFHIVGTWSLPLVDRDEPRFAEASREMIERGDYVVPYFNNHVRFDKPPLAYWAQAASFKIYGENDFAARFPSAIAAALVALLVFVWGSRIGGNRVGWWAAIVFTLSLQTFLHAKAAVADMWLVLFVTLAHWSGYELLRDCLTNDAQPAFARDGLRRGERPMPNSEGVEAPVLRRGLSWSWWLVFYLALAFAFLAKGPIGWTPLATVAATKLFLQDASIAQRFKFVRGILVMLAIVALWGIPALIRTHGEFFTIGIGRHVIGRSFGAMEGHGWNSLGGYILLLPFYFVTIFVSFFPWSIKLPSLVKKLGRSRDKTRLHPSDYGGHVDIYLILGIAVIFVIFTLIKTKLPHYTLPAFPLLTLLLARHCVDNERFLKRCVVGALCVYLAVTLVAAPFAAQIFPAAQLFRQSRQDLRPEMEFGAVEYTEPSLVWYFRSRVTGWMTPLNADGAAEFMEKNGPRFVILPTALVTGIFPNPPTSWKTFSTRGFNVVKGKRVDLTLVLKPE